MAHSSTMITAPVVMPTDIAAVLGISGTDLATNCKSSRINMWARYKPEGVASGLQAMPQDQLTLAQRRLNGFGIKVNYANGYGSIWGLVQDLRAGTARSIFEYIKPSGGSSSPYRLADFNGYYHNAKAPASCPYTPDTVLDVGNDRTLQLYFYANVNGSSQEIGLADLRPTSDSNTFANYYAGILIYNDSTYTAATQEHVMGTSWQEGLDVTLTEVLKNTTYNFVPFFSTLPFATAEQSGTGTIFPMAFSSSQIKTGDGTRWVQIGVVAYIYKNDPTTLRFRWQVTNNLSGIYVFDVSSSNSYITIGNSQQQGTYGYWGINISPVTVQAESSASGDFVVATNLLYAQVDFVREGISSVHVQAAQHTETYIYNGIVYEFEDGA